MLKVLIVDDHAIVRRGLRDILEPVSDMEVAGEAATGAEALEALEASHWDVVVLDISLPNASGLDILKSIKARRPELPVLVLTIHPEEQYAVRALQAGASGYVNKEAAPEELVTALRRIAAGSKYISSALAEKLASDLGGDMTVASHELLSNREFQVMCMIGAGKSIKEIAQKLHLSAKTVSTYRRRILDKMGMQSNADIIRHAVENKLAD